MNDHSWDDIKEQAKNYKPVKRAARHNEKGKQIHERGEGWDYDPNYMTKPQLIERFLAQKETIRTYQKQMLGQVEIATDPNLPEGVMVMIDQARYTRDNNRYKSILDAVEDKVQTLVEGRHEYPIWPMVDGPMDDWEEMYHQPTRHTYYQNTLFLIRVLRKLRTMG